MLEHVDGGDPWWEQQVSRDVSLGSREEAVMPWRDLAVLPGAQTLFYCLVPQAGVTVTAHHGEIRDTALRA